MIRIGMFVVCGCLAAPVCAQTPGDRPGSIAGRVLRPDGIPQPDAEVVAATRGRDGQLRLLRWRARSAFDGQYEIAGVPPGRYLVLVRIVGADAPVAGRPIATLFPGVAATEPGTPVDVFGGVPAEGVDIWLQPDPRRFQVAGRVVDLRGRELDQLVIEFGRPRSRAANLWTITDPGGLFTLEGVVPGPVVLRARAETADGPLIGLVSTELAVESAQDLRIVVQEPGRARGRVVAEGGAALPATLRVALVPTLLRPSALYPADEAAPDAGGRFDLSGGAGEHELELHGLPPGWAVRRIARGGVAAEVTSLWLTPGTALDDIRVEIGPAAARRNVSR